MVIRCKIFVGHGGYDRGDSEVESWPAKIKKRMISFTFHYRHSPMIKAIKNRFM